MSGERAAKTGVGLGVLAHDQTDGTKTIRVLASAFGELAVSSPAKGATLTYTDAGLVSTLSLDIERNGIDTTKTFTFTYNDNNQLTNFTVT